MNDPLPLLRHLIDASIVVLIWLVQLVIYPSFRCVEEARFKSWHASYSRTISFFVIPLMFTQAVLVARSVMVRGTPSSLAAAALVILAWVSTFGLSVPCHRRLSTNGKSAVVIERLIRTNWWRTVAWTAALALGFA